MEPHQRRARDRAGFGDDTEQGSQTRRAVVGSECQRQAGQGDSRTNIDHQGIRACRSAHVLRAQTDAEPARREAHDGLRVTCVGDAGPCTLVRKHVAQRLDDGRFILGQCDDERLAPQLIEADPLLAGERVAGTHDADHVVAADLYAEKLLDSTAAWGAAADDDIEFTRHQFRVAPGGGGGHRFLVRSHLARLGAISRADAQPPGNFVPSTCRFDSAADDS